MKKRLLITILCLCLLLCGCSILERLEGMRGKDESSEDSSGAPAQKEQSGSSGKMKPSFGSFGQKNPQESPDGGVIAEILGGAGEGDLFAVVQNPSSRFYRPLEQESFRQIDLPDLSFGLGQERVFLVLLAEEARISVESVDYLSAFQHFEMTGTLAAVEGKRGDVFAMDTYLAEVIPNVRVAAVPSREIALGLWYSTYDGSGEVEIQYISEDDLLQPLDEYSVIASLSAAAAIQAAVDRQTPDPPEHITPEELMWTPIQYWYTVSAALTLIQDKELGMFGWPSAQLPCSVVHACGEALFPELAHPELDTTFFSWPDPDPTSGRNYGSELCTMLPFDYGNTVSWEVLGTGFDPREKTGFVAVQVDSGYILDQPVIYRVDWVGDPLLDIHSPFSYRLTGLTKLERYP